MEERTAVDETMIRVRGDAYRLYGAVDPKTNEHGHVSPFQATTKRTTR
jgi:transposase-like protein